MVIFPADQSRIRSRSVSVCRQVAKPLVDRRPRPVADESEFFLADQMYQEPRLLLSQTEFKWTNLG